MAQRDRTDAAAADAQTTPDRDLEHVRGQEAAKRALEIAAAGGSGLLEAGVDLLTVQELVGHADAVTTARYDRRGERSRRRAVQALPLRSPG